jgi:uncharacterized protein YegP (UPF0339 family)
MAANNKIMADSAEGYVSFANVTRAIDVVADALHYNVVKITVKKGTVR